MREIFNSHGLADMRLLVRGNVDTIDSDAIDGSRHVTFVSNLDEHAPRPQLRCEGQQ